MTNGGSGTGLREISVLAPPSMLRQIQRLTSAWQNSKFMLPPTPRNDLSAPQPDAAIQQYNHPGSPWQFRDEGLELFVVKMRRDTLADASTPGRVHAYMPDRLHGDEVLDVAVHARRKQVGARLEPSPVCAQHLQQCRAHGQVAVLASLAVDHADDNPLAVNVVELQACCLGAPTR